MSNNDNDNIFENANVLSSYSLDQAIEDGIFIQFEGISPGKWCVTNGVYAAIEEKVQGTGRTVGQALANLMQDTLAFVRQNRESIIQQAQHGIPEFLSEFADYMEGNVTGQELWLSGNETGGFTIMFPEER